MLSKNKLFTFQLINQTFLVKTNNLIKKPLKNIAK